MKDVEPNPDAKYGENGFISTCKDCGMKIFYQHYQLNDPASHPLRPRRDAVTKYEAFNMQMADHRNRHACRLCDAGCGAKLVWRGWMEPNKKQGYFTRATGPDYLIQHRCHKWIEREKPELEQYNLEYTVVPSQQEQQRRQEIADIELRIQTLQKRRGELLGNNERGGGGGAQGQGTY